MDVAVVGDSYAHGSCVPTDQNFVAVIRKRYSATMNLGMSSKGPLMALADLKEYAQQFRPKTVLWFFYEENDFADLKKESHSPLLMRYLTGQFSQGLLGLQPAIDQILEDYVAEQVKGEPESLPETRSRERSKNLRQWVLLKNLRQRLGLLHWVSERVVAKETMELLARVLAVAKRTINSWGGNMYLVYLPKRQRYSDPRRPT
jgi:hypothetical protein